MPKINLQNAKIRLGNNYECITDENGKCTINDVNEGNYDLTIRKKGYATVKDLITIDETGTIPINLELESYVSEGMVFWFDGELSSKNLIQMEDISGNNNDGVGYNFNNDSFKDNNSLYFNGTNNYIDTGIPFNSFINGFTLEAVVKFDDRINSRCLWGEYNPDFGPIFEWNGSTQAYAGIYQTHWNWVQSVDVPYGYVHVMMTHDNTTMNIYINGILKSTRAVGNITKNSKTVKLGVGRTDIASTFMKGNIKSFLMYDRALNDEEVKQNYDIHVSREFIESTDLLASYSGDNHIDNTILVDSTVNQHDATLSGFDNNSWQSDGSIYLNGSTTFATTPLLQRTLSDGATLECIVLDKGRGVATRGLAGDHGASPNIGLLFHRWENASNITTGWYGNEGYRMTVAGTNLPIDQYYLVQLTYDGVNVMKMYINGNFIQQMNIGNLTFSTSNILLFRVQPSASQYWLGNVKLFNIYVYALSENELVDNFNQYVEEGML